MTTILPLAFGWQEILLIALVILLLFGAAKIPALMRSMGKGINEFKKGMNEKDDPADVKKIDTKDDGIDEQTGK